MNYKLIGQQPRLNSRMRGSTGPLCVWLAFACVPLSLVAQPTPPDVAGKHGTHSQQPATAASHKNAGSTALTGDANVISVTYHCANDSSATGTCTANVTKSEFDALVAALDAKMPAASRQALATEYARLVIMASEARRRGVDRLPEFQTLLRFSTLQLLATQLVRDISATPLIPSSAEVEKYFNEHVDDYREVVLSRIFVPAAASSISHGSSPSATAVEAVHARALKGADFAELQREVDGTAPGADTKVRLGPLRCDSLPEGHRDVCRSEVGEISAPLEDKFGHTIYKLESTRELKLDDVRDEIHALLQRRQLEAEIQRVRTPVALQLDEGYFGALPKADVAHKHGMHYPDATPPKTTSEHRH